VNRTGSGSSPVAGFAVSDSAARVMTILEADCI